MVQAITTTNTGTLAIEDVGLDDDLINTHIDCPKNEDIIKQKVIRFQVKKGWGSMC